MLRKRHTVQPIFMVISFPNQKWREGEPQTVSIIRHGEADKISFDLQMELAKRSLRIREVINKFCFVGR
ncbi:hypothetical protein [Nitrosomonas communis]|uniref:Uncharacterized protein n=1 Tax=Nitrosomonas communis TaxID=44574 RepID=A0A1H2ZF37_9PROT|nr:hypothetical protein SAMN05421882_10734 [Nitrosomonas communis]